MGPALMQVNRTKTPGAPAAGAVPPQSFTTCNIMIRSLILTPTGLQGAPRERRRRQGPGSVARLRRKGQGRNPAV